MISEILIGVILQKILSIAVEESDKWERYDGATDTVIIILVRSEKHNGKNILKT